MKHTIQLIEKPNVLAIEQVLKSSRLKDATSKIDEITVQVEVDSVELDFFNQLLSEYCLFLLMDQYLRQQNQLMEVSSLYYKDVLEEIIQEASLKQSILTEVKNVIEEQKDESIWTIKLTPFRAFQLKDVYFKIDDWFIQRELFEGKLPSMEDEVIEIPYESKQEFKTALQQYYSDIDFESELTAFASLRMEIGQETIYLENLNGDIFTLESILDYIGIGLSINEEAVNNAENPQEMEMLIMSKTILSILNVQVIKAYQKDRPFMEILVTEAQELDISVKLNWID